MCDGRHVLISTIIEQFCGQLTEADCVTAVLIYGYRSGDDGTTPSTRFDLQEYVGEEPDFMSGDGAAFVEALLDSIGYYDVPCGSEEQDKY
jgi:hypothetical protein